MCVEIYHISSYNTHIFKVNKFQGSNDPSITFDLFIYPTYFYKIKPAIPESPISENILIYKRERLKNVTNVLHLKMHIALYHLKFLNAVSIK